MSMPPLNPEKSASGIIVDPRTLERVVPASRRKDGSVRKEQKVRAGYVPQEDVGAFRGRRQLEADARRGIVPGANGRPGAKSLNNDNLFAADPAVKSKAAAKNEKRTAKRAEIRSGRNWDSEDDDEDDDEAAARALAALSLKDKEAFPPLGGSASKSSAPASSPKKAQSALAAALQQELKEMTDSEPRKDAPASAWKPVPAVPDSPPRSSVSEGPARASPASTSSPGPKSDGPGPRWSSDRAPQRRQASSTSSSYTNYSPRGKPHPIQGGRIGPIGLAHPPSVEEYEKSERQQRSEKGDRRRQAASTSAADRESTWRRQTPVEQPRRQASTTEPRVRQPVRVREGAGGPLADRVRSLLMQNASPDRPRRSSPAPAGDSK